VIGKILLDIARNGSRELTSEEQRGIADDFTLDVLRARGYFKEPLRFVEPRDDQAAAMIVDANGNAVAMLYWPGHPVEETEAAEQATYALGRCMAAVL
jgi:hypothetical protein